MKILAIDLEVFKIKKKIKPKPKDNIERIKFEVAQEMGLSKKSKTLQKKQGH